MELTDYLIKICEIEKSELLLGEPAFALSLENDEDDNDE
jgi:hypothetical protein